MMDTARKWIAQVIEIGLLLIALGVVLQILFGSNVAFVGAVTANLTGLISQLGQDGLVGLIALAVILWLFLKKAPEA
jgi:hypothetical protein